MDFTVCNSTAARSAVLDAAMVVAGERARTVEPTCSGGKLEIRPRGGARGRRRAALTLSVREFGLLTELARSEGRIVRREDLYERVWGSDLRDGDRSIDVYVRKLRVKLEARAAGLALHPHPRRLRLPVSPRAFTRHVHTTGHASVTD